MKTTTTTHEYDDFGRVVTTTVTEQTDVTPQRVIPEIVVKVDGWAGDETIARAVRKAVARRERRS